MKGRRCSISAGRSRRRCSSRCSARAPARPDPRTRLRRRQRCPAAAPRSGSTRPTSPPDRQPLLADDARDAAGSTARPTRRAPRSRSSSRSTTGPRRSPTGSRPAWSATPSPRTARSSRTPSTGTPRTAAGNVWYLGEDTAEFEDGKLAGRAGSFEAGVDGAQPGIALPADPAPGHAYRQEYYAGEAEDNGAVLSTDEQVEVPAGHYRRRADDARTPCTIEPEVQEYKFYARGVGPVSLGISGGSGARGAGQGGHAPAAATAPGRSAPRIRDTGSPATVPLTRGIWIHAGADRRGRREARRIIRRGLRAHGLSADVAATGEDALWMARRHRLRGDRARRDAARASTASRPAAGCAPTASPPRC